MNNEETKEEATLLRELDGGWSEYLSPEGRKFYKNSETNKITWKPPRKSKAKEKERRKSIQKNRISTWSIPADPEDNVGGIISKGSLRIKSLNDEKQKWHKCIAFLTNSHFVFRRKKKLDDFAGKIPLAGAFIRRERKKTEVYCLGALNCATVHFKSKKDLQAETWYHSIAVVIENLNKPKTLQPTSFDASAFGLQNVFAMNKVTYEFQNTKDFGAELEERKRTENSSMKRILSNNSILETIEEEKNNNSAEKKKKNLENEKRNMRAIFQDNRNDKEEIEKTLKENHRPSFRDGKSEKETALILQKGFSDPNLEKTRQIPLGSSKKKSEESDKTYKEISKQHDKKLGGKEDELFDKTRSLPAQKETASQFENSTSEPNLKLGNFLKNSKEFLNELIYGNKVTKTGQKKIEDKHVLNTQVDNTSTTSNTVIRRRSQIKESLLRNSSSVPNLEKAEKNQRYSLPADYELGHVYEKIPFRAPKLVTKIKLSNENVHQDQVPYKFPTPPGWLAHFDDKRNTYLYENQVRKETWASAKRIDGSVYFYDTQSNRTSWLLPTESNEQFKSHSNIQTDL